MRRLTWGLAAIVFAVLALVFGFEEEGSRSPRGPAPAGSSPSAGASVVVPVARVVDGDTVEVRLGGREEYVRYIGIDTPESVQPGQPVECFGKRAAGANRRLVEGRLVRLVFDRERRDGYGRLLAYVYMDGKLVNARLLAKGYATVLRIPPNTRFSPLFMELERSARAAGRGLWSACRASGVT